MTLIKHRDKCYLIYHTTKPILDFFKSLYIWHQWSTSHNFLNLIFDTANIKELWPNTRNWLNVRNIHTFIQNAATTCAQGMSTEYDTSDDCTKFAICHCMQWTDISYLCYLRGMEPAQRGNHNIVGVLPPTASRLELNPTPSLCLAPTWIYSWTMIYVGLSLVQRRCRLY